MKEIAGSLLIGEDKTTERVLSLLSAALDVFSDVFGAERYSVDELTGALNEILSSGGMSVIPDKSDTVFCGPINSRRGFPSKYLFVVGFNDGVLPKQTLGVDLISDETVKELKHSGVAVSPTNEEMNELFRDELAQAISSAKKVWLSYVSDSGNKPSYMLSLILYRTGLVPYKESFFDTRLIEGSAKEIAETIPTLSLCVEAVLSEKGGENHGAIKETVSEKVEDIQKRADKTEVKTLEKEYPLETTSVSQIKTYLDCPRQYYFKYIMGVDETSSGEVDALDVGNVLHKIIENYMKKFISRDKEAPFDSLSEAKRITGKELERFDKSDIAENERIIAIIKKEAVELCLMAENQIRKGKYSVSSAEKLFFCPVDLGEGKTVTINGKIDRIDTFTEQNDQKSETELRKLARIIDYKTGKSVGLSLRDVYYGKKLQLPVYANVVRGEQYEIGGLFYFPVNDAADGRLVGYCLDDDLAVVACDENAFINDATNGKSEVINFEYRVTPPKTKKEEEKITRKGDLFDRETMDAVIEYSVEAAKTAINEIISGNIAASPIDIGNNRTNCVYCPYQSVCEQNAVVRKQDSVRIDDIKSAIRKNEANE